MANVGQHKGLTGIDTINEPHRAARHRWLWLARLAGILAVPAFTCCLMVTPSDSLWARLGYAFWLAAFFTVFLLGLLDASPFHRTFRRAAPAIVLFSIVAAGAVVHQRANYDPRDGRWTLTIMDIVREAVDVYFDKTGECPNDSPDGASLLSALAEHDRCKQILMNLDVETWAGRGKPLLDAYGNPIRYEKTGGRAGRPVLISAGPDGNIETAGDNIRSDGSP